ncbi:hypothetical protein FRC04_011610 [Tulasnella sp. 424]|nr:hypothetical protein FRC04_011610 [Tulasnella sp. 424]KAG8967192.1 hypothetical protein FRC05_002267 [Tulasnella sp. 425]
MNDSTPEKQPRRVPNPPNAEKKGNLLSVNLAELSAYNPRYTHPHSALKEHLPTIHRIPDEILLHIIHIYVKGSSFPVRDLSALTLVCQRWRAFVEDASSLWGRIDASEGLAAVRKGLRMAKSAALYIKYIQRRSKTDQFAFFKAIGERVSQWRSLVVNARQGEHCSAILKTAIPPRLEKLHLSGNSNLWGRSPGKPLTLFGGAAAPPGLKDVHLEDIPIAVAPLKLACLTSLHLEGIYDLSMSELLRILSDSPALETLTLSLEYMEDPVPIRGLNVPPGWTIQLPSLSRLSLMDLSVALTHFFLSALAAPHLQKLHVECDMEGIRASQLLNDNLIHLVPTFTSLISTASEIKVTIAMESGYKFLAGGLEIDMDLVDDTLLHFQDSFEWLSNHLGRYLSNLPIHLCINNSNSNIAYLEWLTSRAVVTELTLWSNPARDLNPGIEGIISLLSNPIPSSPTSWYLPYLEVFVTDLVGASDSPEIVQMIRQRHTTNREQGEGGMGVPKRFTDIRLSCGRLFTPRSLSPNVEFLKAVDTAGEGSEVFWEGKKWVGTGLEE